MRDNLIDSVMDFNELMRCYGYSVPAQTEVEESAPTSTENGNAIQ